MSWSRFRWKDSGEVKQGVDGLFAPIVPFLGLSLGNLFPCQLDRVVVDGLLASLLGCVRIERSKALSVLDHGVLRCSGQVLIHQLDGCRFQPLH